jgi:histidinol phosphatase-like enzyme
MEKPVGKLLLLFMLSFIVVGPLHAKTKLYKTISVCNSENTAIVFDFHGVVVKKKTGRSISGFFKNKNKIKFLKKLKNRKKGISKEKAFLDKNGEISSDDVRTLNPYVIDEDVIKVVRDLKTKGYPVFLCSNIGEKMFEIYKNQRPDLFGPNGLFYDCWVSGKDNGYVDKSNPKAFELCKKMIKDWASKNGKNLTKFVMVDDSKDKLRIASNVGFSGYKFKKAQKLKCALVQAKTL